MASHPAGTADLVFRSGAVFTVDAARRWAQAVAVRGGTIVAVGSDQEVAGWIGAGTEVVDLDGRMLLPGFQDAHVHPAKGGLRRLRCELGDREDTAGYLDIVATYAAAHPDEAWILGGGWGMDAFPGGIPSKDMLDQLVPDRPVFLVNRDGHGAWVNSAALAQAGIDANTPDPPDGRIERSATGEPVGTLQEGAMGLVERILPPITPETWAAALAEGQRYLLSLGVTSWQDAWVTDEIDRAYRALAAAGSLRARVVGALWWDRAGGIDQVEEMVARRARGAAGRYRPTSVKLMLDGVFENFTASLSESYLDADGHPTQNRGLDFIDPEQLPTIVTRLDAAGFQVHFHAIGDRAVSNALGAVAAARAANGWSDARHHIAHLQVVHPSDLPRFRRLGVVANAQTLWACHEGYQRDLTIPFLGPERAAWQYPFASLRRQGAVLACGSDWSVSTPDPFHQIEVAVRRVAPHDRDEQPFYPEERLDLATALAAFTMGSAYVNHLDAISGSIEVGKSADLAVADANLFDLQFVGDARVVATYVEGELTAGGPEA